MTSKYNIKKQQGFSLIEVLIAFIILVFGVIGLMKLQSFMERQSDYALNSLTALQLSEAKLEYFRTRSEGGSTTATGTIAFADITSSSAQSTIGGIAYNTVWTVTSPPSSSTISSSVKTIQVDTSWLDRYNQTQVVSLKTMISKYSEFDY